MLKRVAKTDKPVAPTAKPRRKPVDIDAGYDRVMQRYPKIMTRLAE